MGPDERRIPQQGVAHEVELTRSFYISVTEVTNEQFRELVPQYVPDFRYSPDSDCPAVNVVWEDADGFCRLLSAREGVVYRLPTEAEWEYACRAGSTGAFCFGDDPEQLRRFGWYDYANERASRVAMLAPNQWGIYDMHGNVVEWVLDWFSYDYYAACAQEGLVTDPRGPDSGRTHVLRGGGWPALNEEACSCTARMPLPIFNRPPFFGHDAGVREAMGFRIVREVD